jgi:hypothetical protein
MHREVEGLYGIVKAGISICTHFRKTTAEEDDGLPAQVGDSH